MVVARCSWHATRRWYNEEAIHCQEVSRVLGDMRTALRPSRVSNPKQGEPSRWDNRSVADGGPCAQSSLSPHSRDAKSPALGGILARQHATRRMLVCLHSTTPRCRNTHDTRRPRAAVVMHPRPIRGCLRAGSWHRDGAACLTMATRRYEVMQGCRGSERGNGW
jgi:hypothetical protein